MSQKTARLHGHGYPFQTEASTTLSYKGKNIGPVFIGDIRYIDAYVWSLQNGFTRVVWDDSGNPCRPQEVNRFDYSESLKEA